MRDQAALERRAERCLRPGRALLRVMSWTLLALLTACAGDSMVGVFNVHQAPEPQTPTSTVVATVDSVSGIWVNAQEIAALPMSGTAWTNVKSTADKACGLPDLANQDSNRDVCVLAKSLVFVRTGLPQYRDSVVAALRYIARSGTYSGRALALARNITGYIIAAQLIDLAGYDPALDQQFRAKLAQLRVTPTTPGPLNLIACHDVRPNNWGLHCGAARLALALYLGLDTDVQKVAQVFRGWTGDRTAYRSFKYGSLSWQSVPSLPVGINPRGAVKNGANIDGVLPDDQRRCGSFVWPPCKTNYAWEGLQGALAQAWMLRRHGYDAFGWGDKALLRAVTWLYTQDSYPATGDDGWQPYMVNHVYNTSFAAPIPGRSGKSVGFTDWTLQ